MKKAFLFAFLAGITLSGYAQNVGIGTTIPTDQLHTTGTVRFQNYSGNGNRLLYIDSAGRLVAPAPATIFSNTTNYAIPDNGCATASGASSPINVSGLGTVPSANIAVRVNITHPFDGDLTLFLQAPNGNLIRLASQAGGAGDNYVNTVFTDAATTSIASGTAPFTGSYLPSAGIAFSCGITPSAGSFASIGGGSINPNGFWTLKVYDGVASDIGVIDDWQIAFEGAYSFSNTTATGPVPYYKNGRLLPGAITNAENGNIGIGTSNPLYDLDVNGTLHTTGAAKIDGSVTLSSGNPATGSVLTATNNAGAAVWAPPASLNTGFRANITVVPTFNSTSITVVPYDDFGLFDDGNDFDNNTNAYTAPSAGVYQFNVALTTTNINAVTAGSAGLSLRVNGSLIARDFLPLSAGGAIKTYWTINTLLKLAAGDVVSAIFSNTGTGVTINGGGSPLGYHFTGVRLY